MTEERAGDTRFTIRVTCTWCGEMSPDLARLAAPHWMATHVCPGGTP